MSHPEPSAVLFVAPGVRGLPFDVLQHLVASRYSAIAAGGRSWALRTLRDVHQTVVGGLRLSVGDTERALAELELHGLVEQVSDAPLRRWMATAAGASAIEYRLRNTQPAAAAAPRG